MSRHNSNTVKTDVGEKRTKSVTMITRRSGEKSTSHPTSCVADFLNQKTFFSAGRGEGKMAGLSMMIRRRCGCSCHAADREHEPHVTRPWVVRNTKNLHG